MKRTIDRYIRAGYSDSTIERLHYLESHTERLDKFLEEYRHLQPEGGPFSEGTIGIIFELFNLEQVICNQQNELMFIQKQTEAILLKFPLLPPSASQQEEQECLF